MHSFGREMLQHWWLDPAHTYLNHGTVGATPRVVLERQQALQREVETHPARFLIRELADLRPEADRRDAPGPRRPRLRDAADRVGAFLGVRGDDVAFVDNASAGVNAVLRSLAPTLRPGDEIALHDLSYGAVIRTATHLAQAAGASVRMFSLPFPVAPHEHGLDAWTGPLKAALSERTRLVILDHVVSETALLLPVAAMAAVARAQGVPVLVDGAHAPVAVPVDIPSLGVDHYVANLHKWAFAPRSTGVLWVDPARQSGVHPTTISWGLDQGYTAEFDWTGTRDPSAWLASPAGLDFAEAVLGLDAMRAWNHARVWEAAATLAERWSLSWSPPPESMVGCMLTMPLPEAATRRFGCEREGAMALKNALFERHRIEAQVLSIRGALYVRLAAQVYNDAADYVRLGEAVLEEAAR